MKFIEWLKDILRRLRLNWRSLKFSFRLTTVIVAIPLTIIATGSLIETILPKKTNPKYGVSFSPKYAEELGLDWKTTFNAMANDLPLSRLRLMSYWDRIESQPDQYDFSELDWQMDAAQQKNIKVTLAIGRRQPRWPECHDPQWLKQKINNRENWQTDLNEFLTKVVERYRNHPALESYQLENESRNANFGLCGGEAPIKLLEEEFKLVKSLDQNHPVYMSVSDQNGVPIKSPTPDAYGLSVYRRVWNGVTPIKFYMNYPTPVWFQIIRKNLIALIKQKPIFIHELQMEPWGPYPTNRLPIDEQNKSMDTNQMKANLEFAKKIGVNEIDMWGVEWWYWRKQFYADPEPFLVIKNELTNKTD